MADFLNKFMVKSVTYSQKDYNSYGGNNTMNEINLYEKKIIQDKEFPVQIFENNIREVRSIFQEHWHEQIEMHYVLNGEADFYCNHKPVHGEPGNLIIINSNELHTGTTKTETFDALVIIFELDKFSEEIVNHNMIFQTLIPTDEKIKNLLFTIRKEDSLKELGYKLAVKAAIYELLTYLMRFYVVESISDQEQLKRNRNLERLNIVFQYIQNNYTEQLSNKDLARVIHLSEPRFCHLFKESMGLSPLKYINEIRLEKAYFLLQQKELNVAEIAEIVGFRDYNNFGRLFKKKYGYAPSEVWERQLSYISATMK